MPRTTGEGTRVESLSGYFQKLFEKLVLFLPNLASGLAILVAFWLVSRAMRLVVRRMGGAARLGDDVGELLAKVSGMAVIAFGVVTALGTMGIDVSALVAGLGLTGFALGFALRDVLSNVLSGVMVLIYKPFVRGDHIKVGANEGRVLGIDLRYTTLAGEGKVILIPNSSLFSETVTKFDSPSTPANP